jgi:hypothetical protein
MVPFAADASLAFQWISVRPVVELILAMMFIYGAIRTLNAFAHGRTY